MRLQRRSACNASRGAIRAVIVPLAAIVLAFCAAAAPARAQSYLRIEIAGHPVTSSPWNEKYKGWLQIEAVEASSDALNAKAGSGAAPSGSWEESGRRWAVFPAILHSGRATAGRLSFGIDDSSSHCATRRSTSRSSHRRSLIITTTTAVRSSANIGSKESACFRWRTRRLRHAQSSS